MLISAQNRICIGKATLGIIFLIFYSSLSSVIAHTFTPDESAKFISLVDQIKSALVPISQQDMSDHAAIKEQAEYARALLTQSVLKELNERNQRIGTELPQLLDTIGNVPSRDLKNNVSMLDDLLAEALTVRVEPGQWANATVQALAFAEDINKVLDEYNAAFNKSTTPMVMSNMTSMNMSSMNTNNMHNMNMSEGRSSMANASKVDIQNINAYQRAVALTDIAIDRFNTELKGKSNATEGMDKMANGLEQLKNSIQSKGSPAKVIGIVHGDIQSSLQSAFSLELAHATDGSIGIMSGTSSNNMNNNSIGHSTQDHMMMKNMS
jgi:hypothetical protein